MSGVVIRQIESSIYATGGMFVLTERRHMRVEARAVAPEPDAGPGVVAEWIGPQMLSIANGYYMITWALDEAYVWPTAYLAAAWMRKWDMVEVVEIVPAESVNVRVMRISQ